MDQREQITESSEDILTLEPEDKSAQSDLQILKSRLINKIHMVKNLEEFFFEIRGELHTLFNMEQATIFAVDREKRELYSKFTLVTVRE